MLLFSSRQRREELYNATIPYFISIQLLMDEQKVKALRDLIHSAQNSINSAKKILASMLNED